MRAYNLPMRLTEMLVAIHTRKKARLILCLGVLSVPIVACRAAAPILPSVRPTAALSTLGAAAELQTALPITSSPTPSPTSQPTFILRIPARWAEASAGAIAQLNARGAPWIWQLDIGEPSLTDLESGLVDAILLEGGGGTQVAQRPLALAVPFTSIWDDFTLKQAEAVLLEGSDFIQVMDWSQMQPTLKSILVEGYHPSDPEYPLRQPWSLHSSPAAEPAMNELALALKEPLEHDQYLELAAVGDLMLARSIGSALERGALNYPFEHVSARLQDADIAIGNLESAIGVGGRPEDKGYTFKAPPETADALSLAGFDLLSLANNHAMDFGPQLLTDAIAALEAQGIRVAGAGENDAVAHQPVIFESNGLRVAFLSYVDVPQEFRGFDTRIWRAGDNRPGVAWADSARMRKEIGRARITADMVVVLLHSGYEYTPQPSPPQINAARTAIEAGAALVIGHHSHLLQPIEFHPRGVIIYGLGNFVFEDAGPPESALANIWLDEGGVRELQFTPMHIDESGRPIPASGESKRAILASLISYTEAWQAQTPELAP